MSLAILNEEKPVDAERAAFFPRALRYVRLVTAVQELHGKHMVKPLYDALGTRIHSGVRRDVDSVIGETLVDIGLPADMAAYADSEKFDTELRASHFDGIDRVGQEVGTPIIAVGDSAFFGPVMSPIPRGEQAVAVWDAVVALGGYDGFFELKRSRTREPIFD